jgi:hypothetical protein
LSSSLRDSTPNATSIRLEARNIYVARTMEAIETALSKYDQIAIPSTTRLGRVTQKMQTCVACDRPLSRRSGRPLSDEENKKSQKAPTGSLGKSKIWDRHL